MGNRKLSKESVPEEDFLEVPPRFLKDHPVSTRFIESEVYGNHYDLKNGEIHMLFLNPFASTDTSMKYSLSVNGNDKHSVGIRGYWLSTGEKIRIDPLEEVRFIFTGELQGCSIYVKRCKRCMM